MNFNKLKKNLMSTIIPVAYVILMVYNFTMKNTPYAISSSTIAYITLLFIATVALNLIYWYEDNDKIRNEIKSIINTQEVNINQKHKEIISIINKQYPYIPFAKQVKDSDFEFIKMVNKATKSIYIVGPNLNFIANEEKGKIKELLFKKMNDNKDFKVSMLLSDPDYKEICFAMSESTFTQTFVKELDDAIKNLIEWGKEAVIKNIESQLSIKKTSIITISLLFIDRELLLVTPIPVNVESKSRPCFLIDKKQHEEAFNKYYDGYSALFTGIKSKDVE